MPLALLRHLARRTTDRVTGGIQGRIIRAARRGIRQPSGSFPDVVSIPPRFGPRLPERVVELLLLQRTYRPGLRVLDIGHANIMECHQKLLRSLPQPRHITGIDIAEPVYDTTRFYERSLRGDVSSSGLPEASFDLIWCVSTLEHVGMDNSGYTSAFETGTHMAAVAVREMMRLIAPGGTILITVPFGRFEDHGWFINYDAPRWTALLAPLQDAAQVREWYFAHTLSGWAQVQPAVLASVGYHSWDNAGAAGLAVAHITRYRA
jgi:SAM-dependent methyltransferase